MKRNFLDLEKKDIETFCAEQGWPKFKAGQIFRWQGRGLESFEDMSDLSKAHREVMKEAFFTGFPTVSDHYVSSKKDSEKFVLAMEDRQIIEVVLMSHRYGFSACLSSQAGCRMGCRFCASAKLGLERNLSRGELLSQLVFLQKVSGNAVSRIDLMGIGEPLDNYEEIIAFIKRIKDPDIMNFSPRKITLSTCGEVDKIRQLAKEDLPITLAVSLHAPNQALREMLMPIARRFDFQELMHAAEDYFDMTGRRVSYEYALFDKINDRREHAIELAQVLKGQNCHVNLIPANAVPGTGLNASTPEAIKAFMEELERRKIQVSLRRSLGQDIQAACGQLRRSHLLADHRGQC